MNGKIDNLEIDFIATNSSKKIYIQVSETILTLDELPINYEGIKQVNIIDWLLEN